MVAINDLLQTINPLAAVSSYPGKIRFENEEDGEEVVLLLRSHPVLNVSWIMGGILLFFIPSIFGVIDFFLKFNLMGSIPFGYRFILTLTWYLFVFSFILEKFLGWYFNALIVTNRRLVDIDFYGMVYKNVAEVDLSKVQDVSYQVGGFLGVMLNFGHLTVQTAAEVTNVEIENIPHPDKVSQKIGELSHATEGGLGEGKNE